MPEQQYGIRGCGGGGRRNRPADQGADGTDRRRVRSPSTARASVHRRPGRSRTARQHGHRWETGQDGEQKQAWGAPCARPDTESLDPPAKRQTRQGADPADGLPPTGHERRGACRRAGALANHGAARLRQEEPHRFSCRLGFQSVHNGRPHGTTTPTGPGLHPAKHEARERTTGLPDTLRPSRREGRSHPSFVVRSSQEPALRAGRTHTPREARQSVCSREIASSACPTK